MLGNEAHVDAGDKGISVVAWVAEDPDESTEDWRFVLQALRTCEHGKQRDTISVQLQHGIIMIYDGRAVRHATSVPNLDGSMKRESFHGSIYFLGFCLFIMYFSFTIHRFCIDYIIVANPIFLNLLTNKTTLFTDTKSQP